MAGHPDDSDDDEQTGDNLGGTGTGTEIALEPIDSANPDVVGTARRRYGSAGAALAAGMLGLDIVLGNKKKPDSVQVQEAPADPIDVDSHGIQVTVDEITSVKAPALERLPPVSLRKKKSRRG